MAQEKTLLQRVFSVLLYRLYRLLTFRLAQSALELSYATLAVSWTIKESFT